MSDLYDLFAGPEEGARMRAQAMADALRRQRGMGQLAMLTGDRVLSPFGQSLVQGAGQQENMLGQAAQQRGQERLRLSLRGGGKSTDPSSPQSRALQQAMKGLYPDMPDSVLGAITEDNYENFRKSLVAKEGVAERRSAVITGAEQRGLDRKQRAYQFAQRLGLDYDKFDLDKQELIADAAERAADRETKDQDKIDAQAKDFGKAYAEGGFPDFYTQHQKAEQILEKYPKDLPGVGFVEGRVPDRFASEDAKLLRYSANQMLLAYQKSITGTGASNTEREAITRATGLIQANDDASVRLGISILKDVMDAKAAALRAAYRPEAVATVSGRLSGAPPSPTRAPAAKVLPKGPDGQPTLDAPPSAAPAGGDMVRVLLNGAPKDVPRANLEKLKALAKQKQWKLEVPNG